MHWHLRSSSRSFGCYQAPKIRRHGFQLLPDPFFLNLDPLLIPSLFGCIQSSSEERDLVNVDITRQEEGDIRCESECELEQV